MKKFLLVLLLFVFVFSSAQSPDMMFGESQETVSKYRGQLHTKLFMAEDTKNGTHIDYYYSKDSLKMVDVYYFREDVCVAFSEYYKKTRAEKKKLLKDLNARYPYLKNDEWGNDEVQIKFMKNKKSLNLMYIAKRDYIHMLLAKKRTL